MLFGPRASSPPASSLPPSSIAPTSSPASGHSVLELFSDDSDVAGTSKAQPTGKRTRTAFAERWDVAHRTDEEVMFAQAAGWTSEFYLHFQMPPGIVKKQVRGQMKTLYVFRCKVHPSSTCTRAREDDSTQASMYKV
ncbi:hypothetical protein BV25DRAFT_1921488 [Artomyces pyxidatus]|uniref:Uncharacterized protein n=1 Tax=Artomyces pyxidatus TaxID=48021 RepID=A0ACB8SH88_9AGAM|nr:hypothetical protein BV25DRAFT_1921488 [Artomyces pyxidatus]